MGTGDLGMFLSPDAKGEYLYGSGQDAVNDAWLVDALIAFARSGETERFIVVEAGGFFVGTAWASYQAFYPPPEWTEWDRWANATRATLPVVGTEGIVTIGPMAVKAGATYLGRTLLGRLITGGGIAASTPQGQEAIKNISRITVPDAKLRYLLTDADKVGGFAKLGFTLNNAEQLRETLLSLGQRVDLSASSAITQYGTKFEQASEIIGPNGTVGRIITVWQIDHGTDVLRFITAIAQPFK